MLVIFVLKGGTLASRPNTGPWPVDGLAPINATRLKRGPDSKEALTQLNPSILHAISKPLCTYHARNKFLAFRRYFDLDQDLPVILCYYINTEGKGGKTNMSIFAIAMILICFLINPFFGILIAVIVIGCACIPKQGKNAKTSTERMQEARSKWDDQ